MIAAPPTGYPPIVFTADFQTSGPGEKAIVGDTVLLRDGRLHLRSAARGTDSGFPLGNSFRDVIVAADCALLDGGDDCYYGVFLRQSGAGRYYTFAVSRSGVVWVRYCDDGRFQDLVHAPLSADMRFNPGLDARNRFRVVACGPCLTFVLNEMVVTGLLVDPRCKEGALGLYLHQGADSPRAEVAADWLQVRAIFPEGT